MLRERSSGIGIWLVVLVLTLRLLTLPLLPFVDPSEARFASAGAQMADNGNWITPMIHLGSEGWVPYWAKPPLHVWMTAACIALFGVSELTARLPAFIEFSLISLLLVVFARSIGVPRAGPLAAGMLVTSAGIFIFGFACITDPTLTLTTSTAIISFALVVHHSHQRTVRRRWSQLFFVALAAGMLTKGPVAIILVGGSLFFWLLLRNAWKELFLLSWLPGMFVFAGISAPWYLLAEKATPGFLYYFFVQENLMRYISHDFGIRFGSGHQQTRGTIWLMLVGVSFPWCFLLTLISKWNAPAWLQKVREDRWLTLALCWGLFPPFFFTFARQILPTYVFPSVPGLALAAALLLLPAFEDTKKNVWKYAIAFYAIVLCVGSIGLSIAAREYIALAVEIPATVVCMVLLRNISTRDRTASLERLIISVAVSGSLLLLAFNPLAEVRLSTKRFAKLVHDALPSDTSTLGVLYREPHSLRLYAEAERTKFSVVPLFENEALDTNVAFVSVRDQDSWELGPDFRMRCGFFQNVAEWNLYYCPPRPEDLLGSQTQCAL